MHPAPSIILFTTLSGLGFGFLFWLGLLGWNQADLGTSWLIALVGGLMSAGGLSFSLGHLGHPERAWMALSQWRSSWLSREGVAAVLCLLSYALWCGLKLFFGIDIPALGILSAVLAGATVFTTSMIYAQLKTVPRWNHFGTPLMFLAYAAAGGAMLYAAIVNGSLIWLALLGLLVAVGVQIAWRALAAARPLSLAGTPETATGLGHLGRVRLFEKPHSGKNYLLNEMVYQLGRKHAVRLALLARLLTAALPAVLLVVALITGWQLLCIAALASFIAGTLCSRWLFFAEAEHAVGLYYGRR